MDVITMEHALSQEEWTPLVVSSSSTEYYPPCHTKVVLLIKKRKVLKLAAVISVVASGFQCGSNRMSMSL